MTRPCIKCGHPSRPAYKKKNGKEQIYNTCGVCHRLGYKYGIDRNQYDAMYEERDGKCDVCSKAEETLCVDHCHSTNKIRGLLCFDCNTGIGKLGDNLDGLSRAVAYLEAAA